MVKPYTENKISDTEFYRTFQHDISDDELVWHRDKQNRRVTIVSGRGWYIQMDDNLPTELKETRTYHIPKNTYHRLIKSPGAENLVLKINESNY